MDDAEFEDALCKCDKFIILRKEIELLQMRVKALEWDQVIEGED
tara:strand:+ start:2923 stop:3054 length:132 start_codon:yes stop_codon:yes gene_type:complete